MTWTRHDDGIAKPEALDLAEEARALLRALVDAKCTDAGVLTQADRIARRLLEDIDIDWGPWSTYVVDTIAGGDWDAYHRWALASCEPRRNHAG